MGRKACLAIGVSDAPPLDFLSGAVNGATTMAAWGRAAGYETELLIDSERPVAISDVAAALARLLPQRLKTERLIVYFAGHGLARDAAEDLWLPSEWFDLQRAIAVGGLRRKLERYGVDQIAIISDACRSLAVDEDSADLTADNVLGRGPHQPSLPFADILKASSRFRAAYMIPGATPDDDRCLFTGVLEEALWGHAEAALDQDRQVGGCRCVTSASLARYLRAEIPRKAQQYRVDVRPDIVAGFLSPDDVYVAAPVAGAPPLRQWPSEAVPTAQGGGGGRTGGPRGWSTRPEYRGHPSVSALTVLSHRGSPGSSRRLASIGAARRADPRQDRVAIERARRDRETRTDRLRAAYDREDRPTHFESGFGFNLIGARARRGLAGRDVQASDVRDRLWWRVEDRRAAFLLEVGPLLVELSDGRWAGAAVIPGFVLSIGIERAGVMSLIYRPMFDSGAGRGTEEAVALLRTGAIRAEAAFDHAVAMRRGKHRDPVRGVIAAYLYDSQGDVDSIRQIAFYYCDAGQPIPYDVALLARLEVHSGRDGLVARIPPIRSRKARSAAETKVGWATRATPAAKGVIAGAFPWLRQGWPLLEDADPPLVAGGVAELVLHLGPAPFTTLDADAGLRLAKLIFGEAQ